MTGVPKSALKLVKYIEQQLPGVYPQEELYSMGRLIVEQLFNLTYTDIITDKPLETGGDLNEKISQIIKRLKNHEPVQYILGQAPFYGREFHVTPDVLVPRQETEELVDMIIKENAGKRLRILDIGTGSGCIAITLSLELPECEVWACDISEGALGVAQKNAGALGGKVSFFRTDILTDGLMQGPFDVIVSNPPYVCEGEKPLLEKNVLEYEPPLALFVPDEDPLVFYRKIAEQAHGQLSGTGVLYFEINESLGEDLCKMLNTMHFVPQIINDVNRKDRFIRAEQEKK